MTLSSVRRRPEYDAVVASETRTTTRRRKHDPKVTEREILDAAEQLLRDRPFSEFSVEAIMSRTGLKRPAFYVHFRDRDDILARIVGDVGGELLAVSDRWLKGSDPDADVRAALEGLVALYTEHGPLLRAIADAAGVDERLAEVYGAAVQLFVDETAQHIREEQAAGRIGALPDVEETARALTRMEERYVADALGREPKKDPQLVLEVLHHIWMSVLYDRPPR